MSEPTVSELRGPELSDVWRQAVGVLGGSEEPAARSGAELERSYREPSRSYHGVAHIRQVIASVAMLGPAGGLGPIDLALATAAACAHDVIYTGAAGADEQASAAWARDAMAAAGVEDRHRMRVAALILATADHVAASGDLTAAVLMDADLAVLGGEPSAYDDYVRAVRREYGHVSDADWVRGRGAVLTRLLDRDSIYRLESARRQWEASARDNMQRELRSLDPAGR